MVYRVIIFWKTFWTKRKAAKNWSFLGEMLIDQHKIFCKMVYKMIIIDENLNFAHFFALYDPKSRKIQSSSG